MTAATEDGPGQAEHGLSLSAEEARVLGCLIEKALTTPEYYPLTLNALKAACNQKSNRDPVVDYGDRTLEAALEGLREKQLAVLVHAADGRVPRYRHTLERRLRLTPPETAALCVLLLRGPQTPGEIRGRSGRMHSFQALAEVQETLASLMNATIPPAVCRLPRRPGLKEVRFAHLLCGEVGPVDTAEAEDPDQPQADLAERVGRLEEQLAALRASHEKLVAQLGGGPDDGG
jgi:uncharacterized protein YceH (UPF0502 family)